MKIKVVKTVRNCPPMEESILYSVPDKDGRENVLICLNPEVEYQEIEGFGGAFTEAAAVTLKNGQKSWKPLPLKILMEPLFRWF